MYYQRLSEWLEENGLTVTIRYQLSSPQGAGWWVADILDGGSRAQFELRTDWYSDVRGWGMNPVSALNELVTTIQGKRVWRNNKPKPDQVPELDDIVELQKAD